MQIDKYSKYLLRRIISNTNLSATKELIRGSSEWLDDGILSQRFFIEWIETHMKYDNILSYVLLHNFYCNAIPIAYLFIFKCFTTYCNFMIISTQSDYNYEAQLL